MIAKLHSQTSLHRFLSSFALTLVSVLALAACSAKTENAHVQDDLSAESINAATTPIYRQSLVTPANYIYPKQNTFKVLSWNVEHFLDEYDDPYIENDRENNPSSSMQGKRENLAIALKEENADIVVLQEFESAKLLRDIANNELTGMGYQFFADAPSHSWYMNVVIMSKFPLGVMYSYGNANTPVLNYLNAKGEKETQRNLNTRAWSIDVFPSENYSFVLTALHLKAGRGERNIGMRLGQIHFLKTQFERFLLEDPQRNILVVGDFNSLPDSAELEALLNGKTKGNRFVDVLEPSVFTHTAIDPRRRLDYAIFNENMASEWVPDSVQTKYYFSPEKQDATADHLPIIAEFYLQDK
ncbi:endonuclease/exonuclease/phosphatase family protein [Agaribacter flavus]|uniref:Endonuclease/exonuclease/phosphatase family protein n=1 Tax=Agaribacter flavus TaxID=1902781 RepID=A0ABV7FV69_9ALTE